MSESVAQRLAAPRWLLNTPPRTGRPNGEWVDSMGQRTDLKFELLMWTPVPIRVSIAPTPSAFSETRQGNSVQESVYSARVCATDYDHYECQTLTHIWN